MTAIIDSEIRTVIQPNSSPEIIHVKTSPFHSRWPLRRKVALVLVAGGILLAALPGCAPTFQPTPEKPTDTALAIPTKPEPTQAKSVEIGQLEKLWRDQPLGLEQAEILKAATTSLFTEKLPSTRTAQELANHSYFFHSDLTPQSSPGGFRAFAAKNSQAALNNLMNRMRQENPQVPQSAQLAEQLKTHFAPTVNMTSLRYAFNAGPNTFLILDMFNDQPLTETYDLLTGGQSESPTPAIRLRSTYLQALVEQQIQQDWERVRSGDPVISTMDRLLHPNLPNLDELEEGNLTEAFKAQDSALDELAAKFGIPLQKPKSSLYPIPKKPPEPWEIPDIYLDYDRRNFAVKKVREDATGLEGKSEDIRDGLNKLVIEYLAGKISQQAGLAHAFNKGSLIDYQNFELILRKANISDGQLYNMFRQGQLYEFLIGLGNIPEIAGTEDNPTTPQERQDLLADALILSSRGDGSIWKKLQKFIPEIEISTFVR